MDLAFAIIDHRDPYGDFYDELLDFVKKHFAHVEAGIQGDAWIWITDNEHKVALDTFSAMQFEVKAETDNPLLHAVIHTLQQAYPVRIYKPPIG
jgi:superoxide dismutase